MGDCENFLRKSQVFTTSEEHEHYLLQTSRKEHVGTYVRLSCIGYETYF